MLGMSQFQVRFFFTMQDGFFCFKKLNLKKTIGLNKNFIIQVNYQTQYIDI